MTERANCVFAAIGFKALDYVFEASTRLKVTWDLLALPEPYLSSTCDLFPFVHQLFKETYRTLLVREQVIFSGESVLDDLRKRNQPFASLERYKYESEEEEFIPSSNPDSVNDFDLSLLKEPEVFCDPLLEIFSKLVHPKEQEEDLFLAKDLIVDHLPHFRRLLPSLTSNLSRLKTLPVADPLLTPGGLVISEDHVFRSYETFLDADTVDVQMSSFIQEDFLPESLLEDEDLLLPEVVDTLLLERPKVTPMTSFSGLWNVFPEPLEEECSVLDILRRTSAQRGWTDMFPFDPPQEDSKEKNTKTSLMEFSGDLEPPAEIEVELVLSLSPKKSSTNIRFSVTELQEEELSPFTLSLMSPRTRTAMETAVWKAEKHPAFVERFLLSEPLTDDPAGGFQHLREASRLFKSELLSSIDTFDEMELQLDAEIPQLIVGQSIEFTEKLSAGGQRSEAPPTLEEEFIKLEPDQEEVGSILPHFTNEGRLQKEVTVDSPPIKLLESVNSKEDSLSAETTEKLEAKRPFMLKNKRVRWSEQTERPPTSTTNHGKNHKPHQELDPLSTFMMLRSQQVLPAAASPQGSAGAAAEENGQTEEKEPPPCAHRGGVMLAGGAVTESEDAGRQQKPHQWTSQLIVRQECPSSRVVRVQAAESQRRAYQELLAFARPRLDSVRQLGLRGPVWGDFSCLAPDQTHFLLKQQEKALRSTSADDAALLRDQELLLSQVVLIHVLVTFKELLLKCDLSSGLVYLSRAAESCADPSLKLLLRKLNIILFLAQKNQESNNKLLELQQLLAAWLRSRTSAEKILVILSVDSDENRSTVLSSLSRVTDAAVTCVRPDEDKVKLNGAGVVSSVCGCDCALVFEQHIGPDFPWTCFSVVVEFDHPGQSPWSAVCSQNSIQHLTFDAVVTDSGPEEVSWCLEENVPYVLFVTEELLNCPSLLQTLESSFNVAVVERSPHPSLQMLGGTHNYAVITVDESTAVVIQELEELDQDRASEVLVMRLTALSLQYNCCWLILFCPDGREGRFSSDAFSNLALVYSSLVLFGMKPEDLDVKVLMVSDVTEMAKSINRICFTTMMRSDWDPVRYLSRDWLTVIPSQDEECLSQFPCVNPLVGQLMLSRFPSLLRLLSASLPKLTELLPEVPQKVLKLFSDITSLYSTSDPAQPHTPFSEANLPATPSNGLWTDSGEQMRLCGGLTPNFLCEADGAEHFFCRQDAESAAFKLDLSGSFCSPDVHLQSSWTRTWTAETQNPRSRAGAAGRVVERLPEDRSPTFSSADLSSHLYGLDSPLNLDFSFSQSPTLNHLLHSPPPPPSTGHSLSQSPPPGAFWSTVCSHEGTAASDSHGSMIWRGRERRRSRDAAGLDGSAALPPLKMGRLSCEKVPGRSDGQTRLRLF